MLIFLYVLCLVAAWLTVPSTLVFLTYGLPTWLGGALFAVLVRQALDLRNSRR